MTALTRPVLRYHGGKWMLAPRILALLPPHKLYVEPYGGAASVLLRKPRAYAELYNDVSDDVVNVFRVLRNERQARQLMRALHLTPFSRRELERSYRIVRDPVERARRAILRSFMGFGSAAFNAQHKTGFRASSNRSGAPPAADWRNYPPHLEAFVERLRGVVIESRPALRVIAAHDRADTLFYVDPPYPRETRGFRRRNAAYRHELTTDDHRELALLLRSVKGMVVLSGYACALYDVELYPDWQRDTLDTYADGGRPRTEVIWRNAAAVRAWRESQDAPELFSPFTHTVP